MCIRDRIYAQRPDATAVLEMERWNRQFGRWVNRGAKSIAVFGDDGQNCLKLYFDVSDTHASRFARPLPIWTMHPAFEPEVIETLEATFGNLAEKENLADAVRSACHNAVADNFTDYLQDLRECREDSLLEELDDLNLEVSYRDALEVSVAYMLMTRLGLPADEYFSPDEFAHVYEFNTPTTINALGIATSDIAEMGLREISRTVMQAQRDQFFANRTRIGYDNSTGHETTGHERSEHHGSDLSDAGRLSGAEFDDAQRTGSPFGQVRGAAEGVPEEAPQGALHQPENQRQAGGASGRDRADRAEDGGADRGADGAGRGLSLIHISVIVRNYSDEEADILVVDYNINREDLLPSEKAKAYKLKLDAMKRQAGRPSKNYLQLGDNFDRRASVKILADQVADNATAIQRYVRLNKLIPPLLDAVDTGTLKFVPAADFLSHLSEKEQTYLLLVMERDEVSPSLGQAQRLKQLSGEGKLENNIIDLIMREEKPLERKVTIRNDRLQKYFPSSYTPKQMEDVIIKLLEGWHRKRQQEQAR